MRLPGSRVRAAGCEGGCVIDVHDAAPGAAGPRSPALPGLVRVSVTTASRRVDLALPGTVPVAELLPELARSVGLLDAGTAHGGYRVLTADGRTLEPDLGLMLQGVADGSVLTLAAVVDDPVPVVYDDVVEAMADAVKRDLPPWRPAAARRTALGAAALLLVLGGVALVLAGDDRSAGIAAAVVAVLLLVGGVVLSRLQEEVEGAVTVAWLATGYAAVAGHLLVASGEGAVEPGLRIVATGGAACLVGLLALLALGRGRVLAAPPLVAGAVYALAGAVSLAGPAAGGDDETGRRVAVALLVLLTVAVLAGNVLPWLALTSTGARADVADLADLADLADIAGAVDSRSGATPVEPVDDERVRADARLAHEILLAVTATVGLLLLAVAPAAVGLGLGGTLLALDASLVVLLRTRQHRSGTEVQLGLGAGLLGLAAVTLTVVLTREEWRGPATVATVVAGAVLLALTLTPRPRATSAATALRRGRLGDVAETAALLLLLPLLVWASGLLGLVGDSAGRL